MAFSRRLATHVFFWTVGAFGFLASDVEAAPGGSVTGTITLKKDGNAKADKSGVVVYLELGEKAPRELDKAKVIVASMTKQERRDAEEEGEGDEPGTLLQRLHGELLLRNPSARRNGRRGRGPRGHRRRCRRAA